MKCVLIIFVPSMTFITSGHDWEDPDDPTVIAENELIGAANSIDAAARKLMALRPRRVEQKVIFSLSVPHSFSFKSSCLNLIILSPAVLIAEEDLEKYIIILSLSLTLRGVGK